MITSIDRLPKRSSPFWICPGTSFTNERRSIFGIFGLSYKSVDQIHPLWNGRFLIPCLLLELSGETNVSQCSSLSGVSFRDEFLTDRRSPLALLPHGSCAWTLEILVAPLAERDSPARWSLQGNPTSSSAVSHDLATENSRSLDASRNEREKQWFLLGLAQTNHRRRIRTRSARHARSSMSSQSWSVADPIVSVLGHREYLSGNGRWRSSGPSLGTVSESWMAICTADVRRRKLSLWYTTFDQTAATMDGQIRSADPSCSALRR